MAWIESHQELARHPKTRRLARALGVSVPAAIGHLHLLWWWALDYADDGDLSGYDASDIADAVLWDGDHQELWAALLQAGFVDSGPDGVRIHDWMHYAGRLLERRKADVDRVRRWRVAKSPVTRNEPVAYDVTVPYRTVPNTDISSESTPKSPEKSPEPPSETREIWDHYLQRIQPKARVCPSAKIKARLQRFSVEDLRTAVDRFAGNYWWMTNNANQGGEWFFRSDSQIDKFLLLPAETQQQYDARQQPRASPNGSVPARRQAIRVEELGYGD